MKESKRETIRTALERAGSLEGLLKEIVRSEPEELRRLRQQFALGTDHPSEDVLRDYALGNVTEEDDDKLTQHLSLCSICTDEVFRIQYLEALREEPTAEWISKIKSFVSRLYFPVAIHAPALEAVRGATEGQERRYRPGTDLVISIESPDDGFVTVFHGCEETGEVELVFPLYAADDPRVSMGQEIPPITGAVEGPLGKQWFKVFWTRVELLDPQKSNLQDRDARDEAVEDFLEAITELGPHDWRASTILFEVVAE